MAGLIAQPEIAREVIRDAEVIGTTLRSSRVAGRIKANRVFADYLNQHHPEVRRLDQLNRTTHIATANAVVERWERSHERVVPLSEADVRAVLSDADDLVQLQHTADRIGRAGVYQSFGISLKYEREAATGGELVRVRSRLCGGGGSGPAHDHRVRDPTKSPLPVLALCSRLGAALLSA